MSWRSDSSQLFAGKWTSSLYAGLGIQAQNVPSAGESGPAALYNDIAAQGAAPTDEMMWEILTAPASGVFTPYESSEFTLVGASDGVHYSTYLGFINGAPYLNPETDDGEWIITMTIGSAGANYDIGGTSTLAFSTTGAVRRNTSASGTTTMTLTTSGNTQRNTTIGGTSAFTVIATGDTTTGNYNIGGVSSVAITASGDTQRNTAISGITSLAVSATGNMHRNTAIGGVSTLIITARANLIVGDQPRFGVIRLLPTNVRIKIRVGA